MVIPCVFVASLDVDITSDSTPWQLPPAPFVT